MSDNKTDKRLVFIVLGIIGVLCIGHFVSILYVLSGLPLPISSESEENIRIEKENRDACLESAKLWMQETYGDAIYKTINIENIDTCHFTDTWMPTTYLSETAIRFSTPFYKNATLFVDSKNHNVIWCDMRLLYEPSFREIYNKWLKQQLGINDDSICLFWKEDCTIDYTEIESLENLNENICSRIRNTEIEQIDINNYEYSTINDLMDYVIFILNTILEKKPEIIGDGFRFIVVTLNEDYFFIHYKKGDNKLRWYKRNYEAQEKITNHKMNSYVIPSLK